MMNEDMREEDIEIVDMETAEEEAMEAQAMENDFFDDVDETNYDPYAGCDVFERDEDF